MRKRTAYILAFLVLLTMTGCRRRIMADSDNVIPETVYQPTPVPMDGEGQQVPDTADTDSEKSQREIDSNGDRVDETVAAQGGETVENAEDIPAGERLTVTLDAMGGECAAGYVTVRAGGVYGVLPVPVLSGQTFQGWFLKPEGGEPINAVTAVLTKSDHTLYAHWTTKTEFNLTFDPNGGRISPYSAEKTVYSGDVYGLLPEPMRSGYAFLGWFTHPEDGEMLRATDVVTLIDDATVYAHWDYDPFSYWSYVLENTTQKVFTCQEVSVYLELAANGTTMLYAPLISNTGSKNIAQKEASAIVSDSWVKEKKPNWIVKLTDNMAAASAVKATVERRFPDARVCVFPTAAVEGTEAEQLYFQLRLAALCYPSYYDETDLGKAAEELGVDGTIFP